MSPKAFTEDERTIVKGQLIEAAKGFLATTGIKKTSVEELCRAAGISKGAFYLFYDSKEIVFLDALESIQRQIHQTIIGEMQRQSDKKQGFITVVSLMYRQFTENAWMLSMINDEYEVLLRRLPKERINAHIELDNASTAQMLDAVADSDKEPELVSAVMRMLFMSTLHRKEVGALADDAFQFMLQAVAEKIFSEAQNDHG